MDQWAHSLAGWFQENMNLNQDQTEIIEYSFFSLFLFAFTLIFTLIFCLILGVLREGLIAAITIAVLRAATGGAHLSSPWRCVALSAVLPAVFGLLGLNVGLLIPQWLLFLSVIFILAWGLYYIIRYAPVDSEAKPIRPERRIVYRRLGIGLAICWAVLALISLYFHFNQIIFASALGFTWQILTLTPIGFHIYNRLSQL